MQKPFVILPPHGADKFGDKICKYEEKVLSKNLRAVLKWDLIQNKNKKMLTEFFGKSGQGKRLRSSVWTNFQWRFAIEEKK